MRPDILNPLFASVSSFRGIGPKLGAWLCRLCGEQVVDVLWHLPTGINERKVLQGEPVENTLATLKMTVTAHQIPRTRRQPCIVFGESDWGEVQLVFFNYHASFLTNKLAIGQSVWVSGHMVKEGSFIKVLHPDYIERDLDKIPEFEAIYPLKAGANGKVIRKLIDQIMPTLPNLPEEIDEDIIKKNHWPTWYRAVQEAHHPKNLNDVDFQAPARQRLAFDELLANQVALHLVRRYNQKQKGKSLPRQDKLKLNLPFVLTMAQQKCLKEIRDDLASADRMTRLLQGDVGSGKTVVALLAALQAVENKTQVAFLAPTDILAHQHFDKIKDLCADLKIHIELLTAREKGKKRDQILADLKAGKINIIIGTHALLEDNVVFHDLGLVIIDEQHRFGVKQRVALAEKEKGVNVLVMTATPIPRTLALTAYGDMDVSILNEKPAGRKPIDTRVMPLSQIDALVERLKNNPTQVYWVCPLVEESEESDLMAAEKRYAALCQLFGDEVGLVHGKMKAAEKDAAMMDFVSGKTKILVSTTVIEVGVDVPSAGLMVVEHAERFGLATLHQLRGRVGRGQEKAVCILLHGRLSEMARERLSVLRESDDGFKIAETDLKLRGAGEVLGIRQSGIPLFKLADVAEHANLLTLANEEAQRILKEDPELKTNRGQALKNMLYLFKKDKEIHLLKAD
ncbi:MAG: ATP-dependent DNA helicase RecG [Alphaproteobacteria bacterium]|nr:ATP-dependent DNA helicase RecG [Alphaproteobacteria bacterium]